MIDDIAGARAGGAAVGRARMLALEGTPGGGGAQDAAIGVSLTGDAAGAGGGGQGGSQPGCEQDRGEVSHHTHRIGRMTGNLYTLYYNDFHQSLQKGAGHGRGLRKMANLQFAP